MRFYSFMIAFAYLFVYNFLAAKQLDNLKKKKKRESNDKMC